MRVVLLVPRCFSSHLLFIFLPPNVLPCYPHPNTHTPPPYQTHTHTPTHTHTHTPTHHTKHTHSPTHTHLTPTLFHLITKARSLFVPHPSNRCVYRMKNNPPTYQAYACCTFIKTLFFRGLTEKAKGHVRSGTSRRV